MAITKKVNFSDYNTGEQYLNQLNDAANRNLQIFMRLLSSYFLSRIDGPNYVRHLKSMAIEVSRVRLALEEIRTDAYYTSTRGEFLYQILVSILFPDEVPDPKLGDIDFKDFLNEIVDIYFQGSIPPSIKRVVELLTKNANIVISENFELAKKPGAKLDISDQFGFNIDIILNGSIDFDLFLADKNIRILLNIIRPAHTLYRLRYIMGDEYFGNQLDPNTGEIDTRLKKVTDSLRSSLDSYSYEDFRKFVEGVEGIDTLGTKKSKSIILESHSADF
jgi:hypothetical protein